MVKIPGTSYRATQLSYTPSATLEGAAVQGQSIAKLGRMVADIADKERVRQDNESFLEAKTKYDNWNLDFESQATQRTGENANGLTRDYEKAESQQRKEVSAGLSKRALRAFDQYSTEQVGRKVKAHAGFEHEQRLVVAKNKFAGSLKTFEQKMQSAPYDIKDHDAEAQQVFALGVSSGALLPSQKESFMADYGGMKQNAWKTLYGLAPEQALGRASEYGVSDSMKAVFAEKHKEQQATAQSITLANDLSSNGKSLKENLNHVHKTYADNPLLHDKLVQRLKLRGAEETASVAAAKAEEKKQLTAQLLAVEVDPNNRGTASEQLASIIESAPPELRKDLTAQAKELLNPSGLTDLEKMAKVEQAVLSKKIRTLEDLQTHYAGISRNDQRKLEETLRKTNKGEAPKLTVDKVTRVLAELGYKKKLANKEDMKKFNALHTAYTAFFEERNPRTLAEEQETNLAFRKHMEQEGIIPDGGWFGDKDLTRAEAVASGKIAEFLPDVDETYRNKLLITTKALDVNAKNKTLLRTHNKAWLPVYESMSEADLKKVISILQRRNVAVTPAVVTQVFERLAGSKG